MATPWCWWSSRRTWPACSTRSRRTCAPGDLVVSLAAGITTDFLESRLPEGSSVVRVMPNTPALVDEGMAALSPGRHCDETHLNEASELLRSCGKVIQIAEKHQDAVTAISGRGPAYIFYVVEAMIEAGVVLGLPRATATELVVQTLYGAATMIKETPAPHGVARTGDLTRWHDGSRAAPARRPQGARRLHQRHGGSG